jgi:FdhD protein
MARVDVGTAEADTGTVVAEGLRRNSTPVRVVSIHGDVRSERADALATEEPMEIRAHGPGQDPVQVAVTMRTPGGDFDLAAGFLFTEGLIGPNDVRQVAYCEDIDTEDQRYNVITVALTRAFDDRLLHRNFFATSSCGVCGKAALEDIEVRCAPVPMGFHVLTTTILELPDRLRSAQRVFDQTGGLHAAGLFTAEGQMISVREDVGRHNAVDKVIGEQLLAGALPIGERILQVSGRVSFEIVQKAAVAGIPVVSAVGAPSSLAVDAGARLGVTIVGFVRDGRCNVYSSDERVI